MNSVKITIIKNLRVRISEDENKIKNLKKEIIDFEKNIIDTKLFLKELLTNDKTYI